MRREVFGQIYRDWTWGGKESRSGVGSDLSGTQGLRLALPSIILQLKAKSLLDAPCGDFNWMSQVELSIPYLGVDIVPEIIARNRQVYQNERRRFLVADIVKDRLPRADLILCRDCLSHLSLVDARQAIHRFIGTGSRYLAVSSYANTSVNGEIPTGDWQPLNLRLPPFNFRAPLLTAWEDSEIAKEYGKHLAIWPLTELRAMLAQ